MSKDKNVKFIFDVMKMKFQNLNEASNALDQKISTLLGFISTITAALLVFFKDYLVFSLCPFTTNLFTIGLFCIFFSFLLLVLTFSTKKYYYPPHEDELYSEESLDSTTYDLVEQTIADLKEGFKENHQIHEEKAKYVNYSLLFFSFGLIIIILQFMNS